MYIESFWYSLMLGLKNANSQILSQNKDDSIEIVQDEHRLSLGEALKQGVVTQQVEELRYQDYKIYNESKNYPYVGDGQAIKLKGKKKNIDNS